jgi:hypothetical protein
MGYAISYAAVRGKPPEAVRAELGLKQTGVITDAIEADFSGAALESGWFLVISNIDARFIEPELLEKLSAGCEVIGCFVEEHVMCSVAIGWRNGQQEWSISHEAEQSMGHLKVEGQPPPGLAKLERDARARLKAQPGTTDYLFDVPGHVAGGLTGFIHDAGAELPLEELALVAPPRKKSWWATFLGR